MGAVVGAFNYTQSQSPMTKVTSILTLMLKRTRQTIETWLSYSLKGEGRMNEEKSFLGLMYVAEELLKKEVLHYDPNNHNNMLVYYSGDDSQPEGWYSVNIHRSISDLFHDKKQMEYVLSVAEEHGIDTEKCFKSARKMLT